MKQGVADSVLQDINKTGPGLAVLRDSETESPDRPDSVLQNIARDSESESLVRQKPTGCSQPEFQLMARLNRELGRPANKLHYDTRARISQRKCKCRVQRSTFKIKLRTLRRVGESTCDTVFLSCASILLVPYFIIARIYNDWNVAITPSAH